MDQMIQDPSTRDLYVRSQVAAIWMQAGVLEIVAAVACVSALLLTARRSR